VALRVGAKWGAGALLVRVLPRESRAPGSIGLALLPQGGISLAMAVSAALTYAGLQVEGVNAVEVLFAVVVLGVVVSELMGPVLTTRVLRRAGEIPAPGDSPETTPVPTGDTPSVEEGGAPGPGAEPGREGP